MFEGPVFGLKECFFSPWTAIEPYFLRGRFHELVHTWTAKYVE